MSGRLDRRDFLKRSLAGSALGAAAFSLEEQAL
ncbi:MAG: twin-arginine translocation signal domain-containing protein, partial [Planctomycetes bacterium]|nr:twin-arginine translocation signal domain-containing protein [Planctomycetota bacterium]